jgi:hypothetical protein
MMLLLTCVTASVVCSSIVSTQSASATDNNSYGDDGYFSMLTDAKADGSEILPVVDADDATVEVQDGWANTRRILFGKQKDTLASEASGFTYGAHKVSAGYKTLAVGEVESVPDANSFSEYGDYAHLKSATTSVAADEALLWADNVVTGGFAFDTNGTYRNSFDSATGPYKSNLAVVSDAVGVYNYSSFEQGLLRAGKLEGVCITAQLSGCASGSYTQQSDSVNNYKVFPLSIGDVSKYFNHTAGYDSTDANLLCLSNLCANDAQGSWLRSANWETADLSYYVWYGGYPDVNYANNTEIGLRPALRLSLNNLLLAADSTDQSQLPLAVTDADKDKSLRLTFADDDELVTRLRVDGAAVTDGSDVQVQAGVSSSIAVSGLSTLGVDADGWGWKIIDPAAIDGSVLASGLTSGDGDIAIPDSLEAWQDYELYVWAQDNGNAEAGWSNRATEPVKMTLEAIDSTVDLGADGYFSTFASGSMPVSAGSYADARRIVFGKQSANGTYTGRTLTASYKLLGVGAINSSTANPFASGNTTASSSTLLGSDEALLFSQDTVTSPFRFTGDHSSTAFDSAVPEYSSSLAITSLQIGKLNYAPFEQKLMRSRPVEGVCGTTTATCENPDEPTDNVSSFSYLTFPLSGGDLKTFMGHSTGCSADKNLANATNYWLRSPKWDASKSVLYATREGGVQSTRAVNAEAGLRPAFRLKLNRLVLAANITDQSQSEGDTRLTFADMKETLSDLQVNGSTDLNTKIAVEQGQTVKVSGTSALTDADGWGWKIIDTTKPSEVVESGYVAGVGAAVITIPTAIPASGTYQLWFWQQRTGNEFEGLTNQASVPVKVPLTVLTPRSALGPDGYFSGLQDTDGDGQILPVIDADNATSDISGDGWASTRRIVFGKQGSSGTYDSKQVSGGYKTLAKGAVVSEAGKSFYESSNDGWTKSSTTSVAANEALLWADDVVTAGFAFDTNASYRNSFDSATGPYKSNLATVSDSVGSANYSLFEQSLLRSAKLEGVCTAAQSAGCNSGSEPVTDPVGSFSVNAYLVFPLSIGDVNKYFGHTSGYSWDANLACPSNICANSVSGSWLRSATWDYSHGVFGVWYDGNLFDYSTDDTGFGMRPALRLQLDNLVLAADSKSQSQSETGDLRLTFAQNDALLSLTKLEATKDGSDVKLTLEGTSTGITSSGLGWKLVDPSTQIVEASGRTNTDVSTVGNMQIPSTVAAGEYDLYVWGQQDGSATEGWSNIATKPLRTTLTIPAAVDEEPTINPVNPEYPPLPNYEVVVPSGFVLDGTHRGENANWVGETDNVQIVVNTIEAGASLKLSVNAQDGSTFSLSQLGGSGSAAFKIRQDGVIGTLSSGDNIFDIDSTGTFTTTVQANWAGDGDKVPDKLKTGKYQGKLLFAVQEVE